MAPCVPMWATPLRPARVWTTDSSSHLQGGVHSLVVSLENLVLEAPGAQGPEDGHGLGDTEGQVEADDGVPGGCLAVAVLDECGLAVRTAQWSVGVRVGGVVEDGFGV